jgi:hypothetical protein
MKFTCMVSTGQLVRKKYFSFSLLHELHLLYKICHLNKKKHFQRFRVVTFLGSCCYVASSDF